VVSRRRERREARWVTVRHAGRAGIASSVIGGGTPVAMASAAPTGAPSGPHAPPSGRHSGSNSPPGPYLLLSVSRQPISLWIASVASISRSRRDVQLQSAFLLAQLADFAEQHADFGRKGLAELVEVLQRRLDRESEHKARSTNSLYVEVDLLLSSGTDSIECVFVALHALGTPTWDRSSERDSSNLS
jgi:hypothetical protein